MKTLNLKNPGCHINFVLLLLFTSNMTYSQYCPSSGDALVDTGITNVSFNNSTPTNLAYTDFTGSQSTTVI